MYFIRFIFKYFILQNTNIGSAMVKNLPDDTGDASSIPGSRIFPREGK